MKLQRKAVLRKPRNQKSRIEREITRILGEGRERKRLSTDFHLFLFPLQ